MRVTKELILEILHIAEDIVDDTTLTENLFFDYDDPEALTYEGEVAFDRIVMAFRVAELRSAFEDE